jgi:hypothetical protein
MLDGSLPINGQYYQRTIPDTLDLAERARLALNGLGGTIDSAMGTNYFFIVYANHRPYMCHHLSDNEIDPKLTGCFPMMRIMSGDRLYEDVEALHRSAVLSRIHDNFYWNLYEPQKPWKHRDTFYTDQIYQDVRPEDVTSVFSDGRIMRALVEWMDLDGRPDWGRLAGELSEGLRQIAIFKDDYAYYPDGGYGGAFNYPRKSGWLRTGEPVSEVEGAEGTVVGYFGNEIQGLSKWYAASQDRGALDLASRLARFTMRPAFWGGTPHPEKREALLNRMPEKLPDPAGVAGHQLGHWYTHFHARAIALRGLLEYGMVTGDDRALNFARKAYEFSTTVGLAKTGFIDCYPAVNDCMEGCALGDLIGLGIRLSDSGMGDYWDDVDACVRNQLAESQLLDAAQLTRIVDASPAYGADHYGWPAYPLYDRQGLYENVIEKSLGLFGSQLWPASIPEPYIMQCCTGNAVNGLYYAWEGSLREDGATATVNLLLNRAGRLVDVDSWLPYAGKVEITNKNAVRIQVRIPGWVRLQDVAFYVDENPRTPGFAGRFAIFDGIKPGSLLRVVFPVKEYEASYTAGYRTRFEQNYTFKFRGSTVVDISERDTRPTSYQLYQRNYLKAGGPAPVRQVTRFAADKLIRNW